MLKYFEISFTNNTELSLKTMRIQFQLLRKLKRITSIKCFRINIIFEFVNQYSKEDFWFSGINDKVCNIYSEIVVDSKDNFTEVVSLRVFYLLNIFFRNNGWSVPEKEMNPNIFLNNELECPYPYITKKWNSDKSMYGQVDIDLKEDFAEFICNCYSKEKKKFLRYNLIKFHYNPFLFRIFFNHVFWEKDYFCIEDINNEIKIIINPKNNFVETFFNPKLNNQDLLEQFVLAMDYKYNEAERNKILDLWESDQYPLHHP